MTKKAVLTAKEFLEKKKLIEKLPKNYYSEYFGGEIEIDSNVPKSEIMVIVADDDDDQYRKYLKLIYTCCPIFKSADFRDELDDIKEPYDVIDKVFAGAITEVFGLGNFIMQKYGFLSVEDTSKIKKQ